jgi:site-specific DNA recombinase
MTNELVRWAFYGRVSTEDNQDPTLSLPRQLANCEAAAGSIGGRIVAHFYDIESGAARYERRGSGRVSGFDIPIPRDGGLLELLEGAGRGRFDVVVCESISRVARNPSVTFRVEEELREAHVRLWAADEPWEESFGSIVLRHVNVGLARGYLHELKVKSRQGIEAAARQGRHAGGTPLYGYRFREVPHPNPHRARQGGKQKILEPDPVRAPIVRMIFEDYVARGMSLGDLQSKLNADLERFPPPESPDPRRRTGRWGRSSVWEILRNPKYTGYQVWNRRARKRGGKANPPEQWIWSEEPAHEPLVSREMFEEAARRSVSRDNVVKAAKARSDFKPRTYLLRSFLRCGACGLRMHGRERHGVSYYACETSRRQAPLVAPEHPKMVYVREDRAVERVIEFLQTHLFGPGRREGLARALEDSDPERDLHQDEAERLRSELADLTVRIRRQMSHLEALEADADAAAEIRSRLRELAALKARRERELEAAERASASKPDREQAQELVDLLPLLDVDAALLAEDSFRELLAALDFRATFEPDRSELRVRVVLAPELLPPNGSGTSSLSSVPPAGLEPATHGLGNRRSLL